MSISSEQLLEEYVNAWFPKNVNMFRVNSELNSSGVCKVNIKKVAIGNGKVFDIMYSWLQTRFEDEFIKQLTKYLKKTYNSIEVIDHYDETFSIKIYKDKQEG